jgi:hypothetical protein
VRVPGEITVMNAASGSVIGRAAILVPAALALWWFLLQGASLWALRNLAWLPLAMLITPAGHDPIRVDPQTGEWVSNVEVNTAARNQQTGQLEHVNSLEIAFRKTDAAVFASGWFSYLALALSTAPFSRKQAKPLPWEKAKLVLWGLGLQTVGNVLCLVAYVYILAYGTLINSPGTPDARVWWVRYFDHINTLVIPFAGPFVIAMLLHPEWRAYAGFAAPAERVVENSGGAAANARRKRRL